MSAGGHLSQARNEIEKLTAPKPTQEAIKAVVDDKAAVLQVIAQYHRAYNDRNVEELRNIWPIMGAKRAPEVSFDGARARGSASDLRLSPETCASQ